MDPTANWDIAGVNASFCVLVSLSVEDKHAGRLPLKNNLVGSRHPSQTVSSYIPGPVSLDQVPEAV